MLNRSAKRIRDDFSGRVIMAVSYIIMGLASLMCILPFIHVIAKSLSSGTAVTSGVVRFIPIGFQLETINYILGETIFYRALANSVLVATIGTTISILVTVMTAYPLSKENLPGRKPLLLLYIFSMLFYGGMIPAYLVVKWLGLVDTYGALILPFVIVQFNMLVVKSSLEQIPPSIEESAMLDGAGYFDILFSIVVPISKPVIATVALLYAVNYWNNYFHAMLYTSSVSMKTLQLFLYDMIYSSDQVMERIISSPGTKISIEGVRSASVVLSMVPIVMIYPLVQRYFVQGITIGSIKG